MVWAIHESIFSAHIVNLTKTDIAGQVLVASNQDRCYRCYATGEHNLRVFKKSANNIGTTACKILMRTACCGICNELAHQPHLR